MNDVVEQGRDRPPARWLKPVSAVAALVAVTVFAVTEVRGGDRGSAGAGDRSTPPLPATTPTLPRWPTATGVCGFEGLLPLVDVSPLIGSDGRPQERTGVRVMVGGRGAYTADLDSGVWRPVPGSSSPRRMVQHLVAAGSEVFGFQWRCGDQSGAGQILRIRNGRAAVSGGASGLLPVAGTDRAWSFQTRATNPSPVSLRRADGFGAGIRLAAGVWPVADTPAGLVVGIPRPKPGSQEASVVGLADPATGATGRILGGEWPVAVHRSFVVTGESCDQAAACALVQRRLTDGRVLRRVTLPRGRQPAGGGALSPDGAMLAFQLSRTEPDRRYRSDHPGPPSDIAVLDLRSGALTVLPGIELASKSSAGLVFSRDGRWLVIALPAGPRARLLVWRPGWDRPREAPASPPGAAGRPVSIVLAPDE